MELKAAERREGQAGGRGTTWAQGCRGAGLNQSFLQLPWDHLRFSLAHLNQKVLMRE
jgi:hypothetical protein